MAEIKVQGSFALVDDDLLELLTQHAWFLDKDGYAVANVGGRGKQIKMHHLVIGKPPEKADLYVTDHKNTNRLDNRRANLRHVSNRYNVVRAYYQSKGYYKRNDNGRWQVSCRWPGLKGGCFVLEEDAKKKVEEIRAEIERQNG